MPSKLTFYRQETSYSCVPACLRMVLSGFSIDTSEAQLLKLCDCNVFGTEALKAVDAARQLGFPNTVKCTLSVDELVAQINSEIYPIIYVNLQPIDGNNSSHAIVVVGVEEATVSVYDPQKGERVIPRSAFEKAWRMQNNLAILVLA